MLSIQAAIKKGWHIGAIATEGDSVGFPTQIEFTPTGLELIDPEFVSNTQAIKQDVGTGTQLLKDGEFQWTRRYRVSAQGKSYSGTGFIRFQACDDEKCLPPQKVEFTLNKSDLAASTSAAIPSQEQANGSSAPNTVKDIGEPIVLDLEPCDLTRPRPQIGNPLSIIVFGPPTDKMVWKATLTRGPDAGVAIYLPKAEQYSLQNTGSDETRFSNTSTYISIDQDGNGALADWEFAATNRPIRIHNSMYRVTEINVQSKKIALQQIDAPLQGSIVGFRCPDFEYRALDGSTISNKTILGKITILDIWAVTCHNCYEGFPKIQSALDKHASKGINVVLLSVDTDRQFYDRLAPGLFRKYGGASWPQALIPDGFNGALALGDYGFGSVVVDETGIVRAVGALGFNIESIIDEVVKNSTSSAPQAEGTASNTLATKVRTDLNRESLLDCFPGLSERLDKMRAENKLLTKQMVDEALAKPLGFLQKPKLPSPTNTTLSPLEIAAKLRTAKLQVGWFYKCDSCDNWHINFGAGFPVAEDGVIATCHHVINPPISGMKEGYLVVLDAQGKIYEIEGIVASDSVSDCALLKIADAKELSPLPLNLAPQVGGESYVLSNPLGVSDYFSHGLINRIIVNSPSADLSESEVRRHMRLNVGAEWAPGSSGAPIVDQCGNLIGFVSAARQLMGPSGQAVQADGKPLQTAVNGLTVFLTAHEAGTAIAIDELIKSTAK